MWKHPYELQYKEEFYPYNGSNITAEVIYTEGTPVGAEDPIDVVTTVHTRTFGKMYFYPFDTVRVVDKPVSV